MPSDRFPLSVRERSAASQRWRAEAGASSPPPKEHAQVLAAESRLDGWVPPLFCAASGGPCASEKRTALHLVAAEVFIAQVLQVAFQLLVGVKAIRNVGGALGGFEHRFVHID